MVFVTRQVHFNAAHKMWNPRWDADKNAEVFGPCANENWHGHNYVLEVTLAGEPDPETGYVFDLGQLKRIIEERIIRHVDHKNLNLDIDWFADTTPSTENFTIAIWNRLKDHVAPATLYAVRLYETPRNYAEYRG